MRAVVRRVASLSMLQFKRVSSPIATAYEAQKMRPRMYSSETYNSFGDLSKETYWKQFYKQQRQKTQSSGNKNLEWLASYDDLKPYLLPLMPKVPYRLLDVGCGVSTLSIELCMDSPVPSQSLCIDISHDALLTLQEKLRGCHIRPSSRIDFLQADVLNMPVQSGSMDIVLDKGTIDSFLKDEDRVQAHSRATLLYKECLRVLKPNGCLIQITDEDPEMRMSLLAPFPCKDPAFDDVKVNYKIVDGNHGDHEHFVYTIRKRM